jgi:MFS family permease
MGLTQLTMSLGFMLGPWGGTALLEHLGGRVVWGVVFVLGLVSAVFLSRLPEREAEKS